MLSDDVRECPTDIHWETNLSVVTNFFTGGGTRENVVELPSGQLFIVRPLSARGHSELIYQDAVASIRHTNQEFHYQLVVQRAYQEGEEELDDDGNGDAVDSLDKDEKSFLLDENLGFRSRFRSDGGRVFAWRDLSGDSGDLYEFVCDKTIAPDKIEQFNMAAIEAQFERKYRTSAENATIKQLREFEQDEDDSVTSPKSRQPTSKQAAERMAKDVKAPKKTTKLIAHTQEVIPPPVAVPAARQPPPAMEVLTQKAAELHFFDYDSGTFLLQDATVVAAVSEVGSFSYWLQITGTDGKEWLGQPVNADMNPIFNFEYLSMVFNHYTEDGSAYSWLLRFKTDKAMEDFQEGVLRALWEKANQMKWAKVSQQDRDYVLEAFNDLTMHDDARETEAQLEDEDEDEEDREAPGQVSEHYDEDEDQDDVETQPHDGNHNSQLAVGTNNDRSYVIRGSSVGVFKHLPNKNLEFSTNISTVKTPQGRAFSPKKVMLHEQDTNMVLQDANNPGSLFRMDLEYGKVVDEWKISDDIAVNNFIPESKFAQRTGTETFLGTSKNALFRIDPRVTGNKLVQEQLKQYMSKNEFSAAATTEKGYIAVASEKGDVRLFDRLGINAKTHIPALGEAIIGLDVSADGRWLLATCKTYLLLIDTLQRDGKNEGKLGFEKSFAKDSKPQPRRLAMKPEHVAQFQHETKTSLSFTTAKFNADPDGKETSIITSTGPFLVTWSLKKVLAGQKDPYQIKRYSDQVIADNFEFGSDKNVILALPDQVDMVSRKAFKRPTRDSIAGGIGSSRLSAGAFSTPRKSNRGRASNLRNEIVNSPY